MINMVIMFHKPEAILAGAFMRIPDVRVISVPVEWSLQSFEFQIQYLHQLLQANGLDYSNIDFFLVESNYGEPSKPKINEELLKYILNQFQKAKIVAYSNTTESLANALILNPRINVMNCSRTLEDDIIAVLHQLFPQEMAFLTGVTHPLSSRIYSLKKLKEAIDYHNKPLSARGRSSPPMATSQEIDLALRRRNTSPLLPMFSLHTMTNAIPVPEERPTEDPDLQYPASTAKGDIYPAGMG